MRPIERGLVGPGVERIIHLRTMHLGPDELLVGAKLAMPRERVAAPTSQRPSTPPKQRVRAAVPSARVIYLEPDLDRGAS